MDAIEIELPLPPRALSKNARVHWRTRAAAFREHRTWGMYKLREACGTAVPLWDGAVMDITWYQVKSGGGTDDDNVIARCAAFRDGFAAAGLVSDDKYITVGDVSVVRVATKAAHRVLIRLERRYAGD